jgi:predicted nucleic acid-binding protein
MTRYLIDTDLLINASKNREPDRTWLLERLRADDHLALCVISLAEFYSGLPRGQDAPFDNFIDQLPVIDVTAEIALMAGSYRYTHARQGRPLSTTDCLIAAAAVHTGATIVTYNTKDYPMPDATVMTPTIDPERPSGRGEETNGSEISDQDS